MGNVLIVDDEVQFLQGLVAVLSDNKDDFRVFTAESGKRALEILNLRPIDLILTDLRMPEMDAFELLAHIASEHPAIPVIVMTAYGTPPIENQLYASGAIEVLSKPIDVDELVEKIKSSLDAIGRKGLLTGISLNNFLHFIAMEQKTCLIEINTQEEEEDKRGLFYFNSGELYDAIFGKLKGQEAALTMLTLKDVKISFRELPKGRVKRRIKCDLMSLLMEGARKLDETEAESRDGEFCIQEEDIQFFSGESTEAPDRSEPPAAQERPFEFVFNDESEAEDEAEPEKHRETDRPIAGPVIVDMASAESSQLDSPSTLIGAEIMGQFQEELDRLKDIDGFLGAGIFSPQGEMVESIGNAGTNMAELGALANDILLKSQKTSEVMGVGRGNMVHIQAPRAQLLIRCLNEATDFASSSTGRAHIHMLVVIEPEGNLAFAKMKLDSVIQDLAPSFR